MDVSHHPLTFRTRMIRPGCFGPGRFAPGPFGPGCHALGNFGPGRFALSLSSDFIVYLLNYLKERHTWNENRLRFILWFSDFALFLRIFGKERQT